MKSTLLTRALEHVEAWPAEAQDRLAEIALDIEAGLAGTEYMPTDAELAGIDRGLREADAGRFATGEQVEEAFARFRRT